MARATRSVANSSTPSSPFFRIGSNPKARRCAAPATTPKASAPGSGWPRLSTPASATLAPVRIAAKSLRGIAGGRATARASKASSARSPSFSSQADEHQPGEGADLAQHLAGAAAADGAEAGEEERQRQQEHHPRAQADPADPAVAERRLRHGRGSPGGAPSGEYLPP